MNNPDEIPMICIWLTPEGKFASDSDDYKDLLDDLSHARLKNESVYYPDKKKLVPLQQMSIQEVGDFITYSVASMRGEIINFVAIP